MNKIKRFFDCQVPVNLCNFECDYCYVTQWRKEEGKGHEKYTEFEYSPEHMVASLTPERLGGICAFNLCGNGETLLHPQIIEFIDLLLKEGHFVSIVTNGTVTKAIDYFCNLKEQLRSHIFIKFSFHYLELLRMKMIDKYFENIKKSHDAGISLTVELVASDSNAPYISEIMNVCQKNLGVLCHVTDARATTTKDIRHLTDTNLDEHTRLWRQFDSALFEYRQKTWGESRNNKFCYGGVWSFHLELATGKLKQCYRNSDTVQYIFENIDEPIHYVPRGNHCLFPHCYNSHVFDCFCGVVPDIISPYYIELRNRILPNGTEWIKPVYKEVYSHRICENNELYSDEGKMFSNGIIGIQNNKEPDKEFVILLKNILKSISAKKCVTVIGSNNIANWINENCMDFIESNNAREKMIIITDFSDFAKLKKNYNCDVDLEVINIVDLYERYKI